MPEIRAGEWDEFLERYPNAHVLQTAAWGTLKSDFEWQAAWLEVGGMVGAQVLFHQLPLGYTLGYIPKGPVGYRGADPELLDAFWSELDVLCKQRQAVFVKVEPDLWEGAGTEINPPAGYNLSQHAIQPQRTLVVDLSGDEETILRRMKQKTRYNVRLAGRKGVEVRPWDDVAGFCQMMLVTGERDAFGVHTQEYYQRAYELFQPRGECELLFAVYEDTPLAAVMVFAHGDRAWYFYGASSGEHRNLMPTYLVQWEAMMWARKQGCREYDLWGVPDAGTQTLEAQFMERADGLWGVYRFKRGFGGELRRAPDPWERVYNPLLYRLYRWRVKA